MNFSNEQFNEIVGEINSKCPDFECPMCKSKGLFPFSKEESQDILYTREGNIIRDNLPIKILPTITGVCPNCGFKASFSLEILCGGKYGI